MEVMIRFVTFQIFKIDHESNNNRIFYLIIDGIISDWTVKISLKMLDC